MGAGVWYSKTLGAFTLHMMLEVDTEGVDDDGESYSKTEEEYTDEYEVLWRDLIDDILYSLPSSFERAMMHEADYTDDGIIVAWNGYAVVTIKAWETHEFITFAPRFMGDPPMPTNNLAYSYCARAAIKFFGELKKRGYKLYVRTGPYTSKIW